MVPGDMIINYGASMLYASNGIVVINNPESIGKSSNKKVSRQILTSKNIPVPAVFMSVDQIDRYPVIARPDYHSRAEDFWFCLNKRDARKARREGATHFIELIENTTELRVHAMATVFKPTDPEHYVSIKSSVKLPVRDNAHPIIKNFEYGYRFYSASTRSGLSRHKLNECRLVAKRALLALGLHFGAVDMAVSYGKIYIYEVNTAPALSHTGDEATRTTADIYAESFKRYFIGKDYANETSRVRTREW
jgi:hypothetical protein